ncbi:PREDICTED: calmodulin-binding protein 60 G-like isoform X2 [Tarenaya hassleriana]|uniref:calmodulin-binding protein 60 G-like isoform X2 n=1 Tax=Tarenaya hassleriana TaxID=28532 RepID=UPI00053C65EA|nr:PREDICTED: calmodulin-binding protein 60 G-like isoform X2 [Tarenaya hassleriana]
MLHQFVLSDLTIVEELRPQTLLQPVENRFRLQFINEFNDRIYTGCSIKSKDGSSTTLELVDSGNGDQRVAFGQLSSLQVEILVLRGDFVKNEWDDDEFCHNIVRNRSGKAPLLDGNVYVTLRAGVGVIENVKFTDVSSRRDGKSFRLGARIISGLTSRGVNIKEARSNEFIVKCGRLKENDKHHPPMPNSEVWRLIQIGKDGPFHRGLENNQISNVKELLRMHNTNPAKLREIIKESGNMSENTWRNVISHAMECATDTNELYVYESGALNQPRLVLNSVHDVVGISIDGSARILSLDQLDPSQQALADQLKLQAYGNTDKLVRLDHNTPPALSRAPLPNPALQIRSDDEFDFSYYLLLHISASTKSCVTHPKMSA